MSVVEILQNELQKSSAEICLDCGGACCVAFPGNEFDSLRLYYAAKTDSSLQEIIATRVGSIDSIPSLHDAIVDANLINGITQKHSMCIFHEDNGCTIYEKRPDVCRAHYCDKLTSVKN